MVAALDKTRKIGKLLHNNNSSKVVFNDICKVMREILESNVLVISRKGKVLGVGLPFLVFFSTTSLPHLGQATPIFSK